MHVASEEGDYSFKRVLQMSEGKTPKVDDATCGLYILPKPDKVVEISIKYLDVNCDSGGLMAVRCCLVSLPAQSLTLPFR